MGVTILNDFPTSYFFKPFSDCSGINLVSLFEHSSIRNKDYYTLNSRVVSLNKQYESNSNFSRLVTLYKYRKLFKEKVCIPGWDYFEYWVIVFLIRPKYVSMIFESTIYESKYTGISGFLKFLFLSKVDLVFAPGIPHQNLSEKLGFRKEVYITGGVGWHNWFNLAMVNREIVEEVTNILYVGRLSEEKGVTMILDLAENFSNFHFQIVGSGPLEDSLKARILDNQIDNVELVGYVNSSELEYYYKNNQILIVPSVSEVWCLAIEEALHFQLPVLISDMVGCREDLIEKFDLGLVFKSGNLEDLIIKFRLISSRSNYSKLVGNISSCSFKQINKYSHLVEKLKDAE